MTELKKYRIVYTIDEVNQLHEEGYRLHSFQMTVPVDSHTRPTGYVMSLQEPSKYDDVERFKKIPIESTEGTVPEGWRIIHHTSKEMIIVSP